MTRLVPLVLSVLLSAFVFGVDAKSKGDQIRVYQFTNDFCDGHPKGANIDAKRDHCVELDGRSIKPEIDEKRAKWLEGVNDGTLRCDLLLYEESGCPIDQHDVTLPLPVEMNLCQTSSSLYAFRSAKFTCSPPTTVEVS
jgi:hypothetical protein